MEPVHTVSKFRSDCFQPEERQGTLARSNANGNGTKTITEAAGSWGIHFPMNSPLTQ